MDYLQLALQGVNLVLSLVGIRYWVAIGRENLSLRTVVWWPVSLMINNALFSTVAIAWYLHDLGLFAQPFSPLLLNYWGQAIRLQAMITMMYGAVIIDRFLRRRTWIRPPS